MKFKSIIGSYSLALIIAATLWGQAMRNHTAHVSAIPLQKMSAGQFCNALTPSGWHVMDADARGASVQLGSAQGMYAHWSGMPVPAGLRTAYYGTLYSTAENALDTMIKAATRDPIRWTSPSHAWEYGYSVRNFETPTSQGLFFTRYMRCRTADSCW
jgi:hypothetical protein